MGGMRQVGDALQYLGKGQEGIREGQEGLRGGQQIIRKNQQSLGKGQAKHADFLAGEQEKVTSHMIHPIISIFRNLKIYDDLIVLAWGCADSLTLAKAKPPPCISDFLLYDVAMRMK
jgi:hypothetical protein